MSETKVERSEQAGRGRGKGRANRAEYSAGTPTNKKSKGLCEALGDHVFDYGQKGAADLAKTSYEALVRHIGTTYGPDIGNELENRKTLVIPKPEYTQETVDRNVQATKRRDDQHLRLSTARKAKLLVIREDADKGDGDALIAQANLQNEMEEANYQASIPLPMTLEGDELTEHNNAWRTYRDRVSALVKHRGQAFSMLRGQCMPVLLDKMKYDKDWDAVSVSYSPLLLMNMIERIVLAQTEDQFPFATVYEQECALLGFHQNELTNEQWYERFNTKVDVGAAIGVTRQHRVLLEHTAGEMNPPTKFDDLTAEQQKKVRDETEERYISYVFLKNSGKQHSKLRMDLQNDYTTGDDHYPRTRQSVLHLLDKYSKSVVFKPTPNEGNSFAQGGGKDKDGEKPPFDKKYWKDKKCNRCHQFGHPSSHCDTDLSSDKKKMVKKPKKDDDDESVSSKASKSSKSSVKDIGKLKKSFAQMQNALESMTKEDSDDTESEEDAQGHLQFTF